MLKAEQRKEAVCTDSWNWQGGETAPKTSRWRGSAIARYV